MEKIRTFIAVTLPDDVSEALGAVSQELAPQVPEKSVKWVTPERIHLTLRFLGDTPVDKLDDVASGLDRVAAGRAPFTLHLDQLGCFPNERRPRVIWVGVRGATEEVAALKEAIDEMLDPLGWEPERRSFHPHLTLGRVKRNHRQVALPWGSPVVSRPIPVDAVHLIESRLRPEGPVYTVRHTSSLQ
ncbi:MAG: RNA 2',3'-cyclic phosphodiesterase [Candidatus Promineifilaceae bacterium]|nr:RNA 2',3'-cyclic phosphodiesterase [Candidatus Promineifilaceae bacterium]